MARKRLSTLAITTTLAAVGVGVVGTGAANAATGTPLAHSQDNQAASTTTTGLTVKTFVGDKVTADLAGTVIDSNATAANVKVTIDWGDSTKSDVAVDPTTLKVDQFTTHAYKAPGPYTVTLTVVDGISSTPMTSTKQVTATQSGLAAPVLKAALAPASTVKKNTAVTLSLAGSSVDPAAKPTTTINWGDGSKAVSAAGDLTKIPAADLTHTFTADGKYNVVVTLDDGVGDAVQTQTIAVTVSETAGVQVLQAAGDTRYQTGIQISQHQWAKAGDTTDTRSQAKAVVLATGRSFPDALAGGPLAKKVGGPLLLTDGTQTTVDAGVLGEIQRILPTKDTKVYILGGTQAMNAGIESQLQKLGYTTDRLAGEDRFQTALKIAQDGMGNPTHIIVARGDEGQNHDGFADALSASSYAANVFGGGNSAVILSNYKTFDPATQAYVTSKLKAGQQNVAAIGGQAAAAMTTITGSAGTYSTAIGRDRYQTAAMVASAFLPNGKADQIGIATGTVYADALTGGAYMATVNGPLLLTDPKVLPAYTADAIGGFSTQEVNIFGGNAAISPTVAKEIAALVKVTTIGKF